MAKATLFGMDLVPPEQFTERYYTVRGREFHQVRFLVLAISHWAACVCVCVLVCLLGPVRIIARRDALAAASMRPSQSRNDALTVHSHAPRCHNPIEQQVFQGLPLLSPLYMEWEKNHNAERLYWLIVDNPWIPWFSLCVYLLFIFGYPSVAQRYGWGYISARFQMASWNLFLAAFSWIGALRVVPHFFFLVKTRGLDQVGRSCNPIHTHT